MCVILCGIVVVIIDVLIERLVPGWIEGFINCVGFVLELVKYAVEVRVAEPVRVHTGKVLPTENCAHTHKHTQMQINKQTDKKKSGQAKTCAYE